MYILFLYYIYILYKTEIYAHAVYISADRPGIFTDV